MQILMIKVISVGKLKFYSFNFSYLVLRLESCNWCRFVKYFNIKSVFRRSLWIRSIEAEILWKITKIGKWKNYCFLVILQILEELFKYCLQNPETIRILCCKKSLCWLKLKKKIHFMWCTDASHSFYLWKIVFLCCSGFFKSFRHLRIRFKNNKSNIFVKLPTKWQIIVIYIKFWEHKHSMMIGNMQNSKKIFHVYFLFIPQLSVGLVTKKSHLSYWKIPLFI